MDGEKSESLTLSLDCLLMLPEEEGEGDNSLSPSSFFLLNHSSIESNFGEDRFLFH